MQAKVLWLECDLLRAGVLVTDEKGIEHSYIVRLRNWIGADKDLYFVLGDKMEIYNPDTRYLVNRALLDFQQYHY